MRSEERAQLTEKCTQQIKSHRDDIIYDATPCGVCEVGAALHRKLRYAALTVTHNFATA